MSLSSRGKRPRWLCGALLVLSCALWLVPAAAAPKKVPLMTGESLDESGKQKPVNPRTRQMLDYLERELDIQFDIKLMPWIRAESNAMAGHGMIFGLSKTPERVRELRFSDVAAANNLWLVTRSDEVFRFNAIEDLRGKTLGAVRGYSYGEEFDRAKNSVFRVADDIASRPVRLTRLMLRRVDAVLLYQPDSDSAAELEAQVNALMAPRLKEMGITDRVPYSVLPKPMQVDNQLYFAVLKSKDDGMIDKINAALARRRKSASLPASRPH